VGRIEALVHSRHLGVGYAGYWDAAPLDWLSHEHLRVFPLTRVFGHTEPMSIARVAAWYRPRGNIGQATVATYPYDIAAYLHRPIN
jgi:hypothetical protein